MNSTITLHPQACDLMFQNYRVLSRIFRDVLGQLESITFLSPYCRHRMSYYFYRPDPPSNITSLKNNYGNLINAFVWNFLYRIRANHGKHYIAMNTEKHCDTLSKKCQSLVWESLCPLYLKSIVWFTLLLRSQRTRKFKINLWIKQTYYKNLANFVCKEL